MTASVTHAIVCSVKEMVHCLEISISGEITEIECAHDKIHKLLGGRLTFVGTLPDKQISAVALSIAQDVKAAEEKNNYEFQRDQFDIPIYGRVIFVKNDDNGEPLDLHLTDL